MTIQKIEGERVAVLEANMININERLKGIEESMANLNGKFDLITQNYVAKETFEEFKKNRWLERVVTILMTALIAGLVEYFLTGRHL